MAAKSTVADKKVQPRIKRSAKRRPWVRAFKFGAGVIFLGLIVSGSAAGIVWINALNWADQQLDHGLQAKLTVFASGKSTKMFARDGKTVLYEACDQTRDPIEHFEDIPTNVIHATLAAEDRRFFDHNGIDYYSLGRSIVTDVREHRTAQGASTITMQLVKNLFTSPEKSFSRKLHDAALAVSLEKRLTKQQILTDYLNQSYYGDGAYGFKAASEVYFGKADLKSLTVGEAALLARLVRRPTDENPFRDLQKSIDNRNDVLYEELQMGWITQDAYSKACDEKVHLVPKHFGSGETFYKYKYFVHYVLDCLKKDFPDIDFKAGGYTIETTIDPAMEEASERDLRRGIEQNRGYRITTGAFMLMNSDGQILSMVGGLDFDKHQYNAVVQGRRQPGSSFKPIVYATALSTGAISPTDTISSGAYTYTDPQSGETWSPQNDNGFGGNVSIAEAIAGSINTCAARVMEKVGPDTVVSYAHDVFGYTSPLEPRMALALGAGAVSPIEQAQAYSVFMLHGDRATPYGITKILGPDNSVVQSYEPDIHKNMLDSNVAAQMDIYLRGVVTGGTATRARDVEDARGKTGTTDDNRNAWFCGYTNNLLGICWVANEQSSGGHLATYEPMSRHSFGGIVPAEIWASILKSAQNKYGTGAPPPPAEKIDASTQASDDESDKTQTDDSEKPKDRKTDADSTDNSDNTDNSDTTDSGDNTNTPVDNQGVKRDDPPAPVRKRTPPPADPEDKPTESDSPPVASSAPARNSRETVTVEICADTGLRATVYCPETVRRTFIKGTEPKRYCTKHHQ